MSVPQELAAGPQEAQPARRDAASGRGRSLLVASCFVVYLQSLPVRTGFLMPILLLAAAGAATAACVVAGHRPAGPHGDRVLTGAVGALVVYGLLFSGLRLGAVGIQHGVPAGAAAVGLAVYLGLGVAASFDRRAWFLPVFLTLQVALLGLVIAAADAHIDVWHFLQQGAHALLNGGDPYAIRISDPYTRAETLRYYSPGVVVDGRLTFGFPYLPVSLLAAVPGFLVGDVRYAELALLVVATVLLLRIASDRAGRALAVVGIAGPTSVSLVLNAWVEPTLMVGLAVLTVAALRQRWGQGALGLVLFLGTKQYVVVVLPLLRALRQHIGRRGVLVGLAGTAMLVAPFVLAGPSEFYRSVVEFHLRQPFRSDSVSLLVSSVHTFGWPPPGWSGPLPLVAGLATSVLLGWRLPRTTVALVVSMGVALLVTVLLSKQAFSNYYSLIAFAFLLGAVIWPAPGAHEAR